MNTNSSAMNESAPAVVTFRKVCILVAVGMSLWLAWGMAKNKIGGGTKDAPAAVLKDAGTRAK